MNKIEKSENKKKNKEKNKEKNKYKENISNKENKKEEFFHKGKEIINENLNILFKYIKNKPIISLFIATSIGYILGKITSSKNK